MIEISWRNLQDFFAIDTQDLHRETYPSNPFLSLKLEKGLEE